MLKSLNDFLWGPGTLALLLGTGIFLTVRMRFLPWRRLGFALRSALGREARQAGADGVSPFSALMTALAATIGTGNIVGVSTALVAGGPGALLWMEVSAMLGMATIFAESTLAVKYRRRDRQGRWAGGPMYLLEHIFGPQRGRTLGLVFALFAVGASLGLGSMTQANAVAESLSAAFSLPAGPVGLATAALALAGILGGIRTISRITSVLVPVMALLYLGAGLAVILGNLENLPAGLTAILRSALCPQAAAGGLAGMWTTARWGVARGVFSNEAGLGSAGIAAASADTRNPAQQGCISMTGAFFDTIVICTVTGLAICCSGALGAADGAGNPVDGASLTILAFETVLGDRAGRWIAVSIVLFAFSTILGWEYQGETAFAYLTRDRGRMAYRILYALAALWGASARLETVYLFADICNALMCFPNLLALWVLQGEAVAAIRGLPARGGLRRNRKSATMK